MSSDTDPNIGTIPPPPDPRASFLTWLMQVLSSPAAKKIGQALVVLAVYISARAEGCRAKEEAERAAARGARSEAVAKTSAVVAKATDLELDASYAAFREKAEATAGEVVKLRKDLDTARKDLETERKRIDRLLGRRSTRAAPPAPAPVAPAVNEPLPPTPAAAAAELKETP